jgi:CRP-like cAMP-binding protein
MQAEARSWRKEAVAAHPLADLLACPAATGTLLNRAAQGIDFLAGETVFRQMGICRGLYVIVEGRFLRKAERMETHLTLGTARAGDLVELAATLGNRLHTYTLSAQSAGSVLLLPMEALERAFESHPPLRMQLLGELAREVSRAYDVCCLDRILPARRRSSGVAQA